MWTWRTLVTVLLLILPVLSVDLIRTTCEIPSVEVGDNTTLTIYFGEDLTQERIVDFSVTHLDRNFRETHMLSCIFSYGDVQCDKTPCCTWESKVTDVFRVYIHNASQQLEGKFWGFVIPADIKYQKYCSFTLKASTCSTDSINTRNRHMTCNNQFVNVGQACTVTCNPGHYFQENQNSVTYKCVGKNKWSPETPNTSCEALTCSENSIIAANSRLTCDDKSLTIGHTCTVICNPDHYFQGNQTFVTYICVGKNKWSPEIPIISCEERSNGQELNTSFSLYLLFFVIPIIYVIVIAICCLKRSLEEWKGHSLQSLQEEKEFCPKCARSFHVNVGNSASVV